MIARSAVAALTLAVALPPVADARAGEEPQAKLSLDVREGDLRQILAALAEVGDFQLVVDPDVSCRLTLAVQALPWPEMLDQVLRACGLGQEAEGSVVRVAPLARLQAESRGRREVAQARGTVARGVELRPLSYARAEELAPVLQSQLGDEAEVVFDRRTNTLIIVRR